MRPPRRYDVGDGRRLTVAEIASETGISVSSARMRVARGWTGKRLMTPGRVSADRSAGHACSWCGLVGHYERACWVRVGGRRRADAIDAAVSRLARVDRDRLVARLRMRAVLDSAAEAGANVDAMLRLLGDRL